MPRPRHTELPWSLDRHNPSSIADARIALLVLRLARRLKGVIPPEQYDDFGRAFVPVIAKFPRELRAAMEAARSEQRAGRGVAELPELSPEPLAELEVLEWLGDALANNRASCRTLFDRVESRLERFVATTDHPSDRNVEILARLVGFSPADVGFVRMAAWFYYGTLSRRLICFVVNRTRIMAALPIITGGSSPAHFRIFDHGQPLARSGLFDSLSNVPLNGDLEDCSRLSLLGERLLCTPYEDVDSMSAAVLRPLPPASSQELNWPHLATQRALLVAALGNSLETGNRGVNILLYGAPGTGKTEFARRIVDDIGAKGFVVADADDYGGESSRRDRLSSLRLTQTFASECQRAILVLDEAEDIFASDYDSPFNMIRERGESKAWMNSLLERNRHPVIWISNRVRHIDPAYLRRFTFCLEFRRTPRSVRRDIARQYLPAVGCSEYLVEAVAARESVSPAMLDSAATFVAMTRSSKISADEAVRCALEEQLQARGRTEAVVIPKRATRFDLRYLNIEGNAQPERVMAALAHAPAASLLFSGPPGTGKTQFAAEIASTLGRELVYRTASDINSKWYGESEQNVAQLFQECDPKSEVLFVDEAEVLLGSRAAAESRPDRAVTAEFLRRLETFEGVFVCATNHSAIFDEALMRRFVFRLAFKPLSASQRLDLFRESALGWDGRSKPPTLPAQVGRRLAFLDTLTPGDVANVVKRFRVLGMTATPGQWVEELEREVAAKDSRSTSRIGFA